MGRVNTNVAEYASKNVASLAEAAIQGNDINSNRGKVNTC